MAGLLIFLLFFFLEEDSLKESQMAGFRKPGIRFYSLSLTCGEVDL